MLLHHEAVDSSPCPFFIAYPDVFYKKGGERLDIAQGPPVTCDENTCSFDLFSTATAATK